MSFGNLLPMRRNVLAIGLTLAALGLAGPSALAAPEAPHTFVLTYRDFGPIQATGVFKPADGYEVRSEGCYAKHSDEAVCGFTLRATRPLTVTNLDNAARGAGADGSAIRTCCLFVQGDNRGYPITRAASAPAGVAVLSHPLSPGQQVGLMLRAPNYRKAAPLAAITFSRGQGDPGITFSEHVRELP